MPRLCYYEKLSLSACVGGGVSGGVTGVSFRADPVKTRDASVSTTQTFVMGQNLGPHGCLPRTQRKALKIWRFGCGVSLQDGVAWLRP